MNIPACISGAADCVRKRSARDVPQVAATIAIPITTTSATASPSSPGQWAPAMRATTSRNVAGSSARRPAERTSPARITGLGAGEASSRSNQPPSMSRARLTPVAAPVNAAPCIRLTGMMKLW